MPALFVSGTDTGVGKSVVTALLVRAMRSLGVDCVAMKPFASGCAWRDGVLQSEDADFLRVVGGFDSPLELVCPIRLEKALAPLVAAQQDSIATTNWPSLAHKAFEELKRRHQWVIVEGVGGWFVPIWHRADGSIATCADLVSSWNLPVVVVARRTLGTINHTTLTCRAIRETAELRGVVFCDADFVAQDDLASQTSPHVACELAQTRELGFIPHSGDWDEAMKALLPFAREMMNK